VNRAVRYGVIAGGVILTLVLVAICFPWNALRGPLARYASSQFERQVTIEGPIDVKLGWSTWVQIDDVSIANVAWSKEQPMVRAKRVILWFRLGSLLRGEPHRAHLIETNVLLERNAKGEDNWHFGDTVEAVPRIANIDVDRGVVRYKDAKLDADIRLGLQSTAATADAPSALRIDGHGTLRGESLGLDGQTRGLAQLQDINDPYQITVNARAGRTKLAFDGSIVPADPENLRGRLRVQGPDLSRLHPMVPSPLPWTPPYDLGGELTHQKDVWIFRGIKGTVGDSDLAGDFRIDLSTQRPKTIADLTSARFNYKDLGGFIGLPPGEPGRVQTPEQKKEVVKREVTGRVLPDTPFELDKLRDYDADVRFRGRHVKFGDVPIDNLVSHLKLEKGVLRFDPLDFGVADGRVVSNVRLDANPSPPQVQGQIEARNVELKRIFPKLASPQGTAGRFGGRANFKTQGNSLAKMAAAADGDAAAIMRGGEASTLQLVLTNLDLARAAELLLRGDQTAEIRCAVTGFSARSGVIQPDLFVIDTSAVVITGEGKVDFREEKYDLALKAQSKRPSPLALRGPIVITGTFKNPDVRPAIGPVAARIGAAIGLGVLSPPLAVLPLIDFGGASDVDCRALLDRAREKTGTTEALARAKPPAKQQATGSKAEARAGNGGRRRPTAAVAERANAAP
jgi:uncharacterized protein involved in outer membrane biogenesis